MNLASVLISFAVSASPASRAALIVSNDEGLGEDAPLRYTAKDADRVAQVLVEFGHLERSSVHRVSNKDPAELLKVLEKLASEPKRESLFFYYSGHADSAGLRMAGATLSFATLIQKLKAIPSSLHMAVIDGCQSGGAARAKGVRPVAPFEVRIDPGNAEGLIVVTSSASDEQSYESEETEGAIFTAHWTTGLRGAADSNNDNQVTLSEVFSYAYAQTLRATLLSPSGPQHPTYRWDFTARRDPVLSLVNASSTLTIGSDDEASYAIFDSQQRNVIAEVPLSKGEQRRVALSEGEYVVKKRGTKGVFVAKVRLGTNDDLVLDGQQMLPVPLLRLTRKGSNGNGWVSARIGQYLSPLLTTGAFQLNLGGELEFRRALVFGELALSAATESHGLTSTTQYLGGLLFGVLYSFSFRPVSIRLGPTLGPVLILQQSLYLSKAGGGQGGLRLRLDVRLSERVDLVAIVDAMALFVPLGPDIPWSARINQRWGFLGHASYSLGARFFW